MKHLLFILSTFVILHSSFADSATPPAPVPQTGQTLCYNSTGAVIPCAGTGQDGDINSGVAWPNPRFSDFGNGTVTDNLTGLMWTKDANLPLAVKTWQPALDYVAAMNAGTIANFGYTDWRLPSILELQGLVDASRSNPALPVGHPFTTVEYLGNDYWSSTTRADTDAAWSVSMSNGGVYGTGKTSNPLYVWPVRNGQILNAPAPPPKSGQTTSYYALDDGALQTGVAWPTTRFIDNGNGSVTDNRTGLVWLKNAGCFPAQNWDTALVSVNALEDGTCGLTDLSMAGDWHLPNKNELLSLVDYGRSNPVLTLSHPFMSVKSDLYWAATTFSLLKSYGWVANLNYGHMYYGSKADSGYVWPVRSGQYLSLEYLILYVATTEYGNVGAGTTGALNQIRLRNNGVTSLVITATALIGADATQFTVATGGSNACTSLTPVLAAGTICTLAVTATPTSSGAKSASLTITTASGSMDIPLNATAFTTIYGVVTDQATGLPVSGATVTLNTAATATTGVDGSYKFGALSSATYSINIAKTGYQTTTKSGLAITASASAKADILLPTVGTLNVTSTFLPWASPNVAYSSRVMVTGGTAPYTFTVANGSLPTGLSLDTTTGTISGTSSGTGSYTFAIGVRDNTATGYSEKEYTIGLLSPLQITTLTLPASQQGSAYSATVAATGGKPAYNFSLINSTVLPTGLTLNATSGAISGTSRENGTFNITIRATDSTGITADKSYTLIMAASAALTIDTTTLPQGVIGTAYSTTLAASGGVPARTFSVAGTLPAGLIFSTSTGKLSGTPTAAGLTNQTFSVSDYSYPTAQTASIVLPLRIWSSAPVNGTCGSSNSSAFTISPTANLCTTGTASTVTGAGPWSWTCTGTNGGTTATCSASITTIISKPGDCDNSGTVTIAEVQSAINMFLGLKTVEACVDLDNSNGVSIAEVQKVINSFLGL